MKTVLIRKNKENHTHIFDVLCRLDMELEKYKWWISELSPNQHVLLNKQRDLFSYRSLIKYMNGTDVYIMFGAFIGFKNDVACEDIIISNSIPSGESEMLWKDTVEFQHPLSEIEIYEHDDMFIVLICKEDYIAEKALKFFSNSEDLEQRNIRVNAQIARIENLIKDQLQIMNINQNDENVNKKYIVWYETFRVMDGYVTDEYLIQCIKKHI